MAGSSCVPAAGSTMRLTACRLLCAALVVIVEPSGAIEGRPLRLHTLEVHARTGELPDLVCPKAPGAGQPRPPVPAPPPEMALPEPDEVVAALEADRADRAEPADAAPEGNRLRPLSPIGERFRIGVWGDSHIAAAFFTEELARILAPTDRPATPRFVQAGFGHPGVRGLVRKSCVSPGWTRDPAHARRSAAATPGPGLVTLVSTQGGSMMSWDLRDAAGQPQSSVLELLYDAAEDAARIAVRVDGGEEQVVMLNADGGPAALELRSDGAMSLLQIRLLGGTFKFQGLRLDVQPALQLDVFGYPGATAAGWAGLDLDYFGAWFGDDAYDLVLMAFGTNEANDPDFKPERYRAVLSQAVVNLRRFAPEARCLLLAPGDRGVKVPVSRARRAAPPKGRTSGQPNPAWPDRRAPKVDLLRYAHLHQTIAGIQRDVAAAQGCQAWSAQTAMGGIGSAYNWARTVPPLMAPDLLHFTAAGYRRLAHRLAGDLGWER
jgi:lysophospholipase L1-like esterase